MLSDLSQGSKLYLLDQFNYLHHKQLTLQDVRISRRTDLINSSVVYIKPIRACNLNIETMFEYNRLDMAEFFDTHMLDIPDNPSRYITKSDLLDYISYYYGIEIKSFEIMDELIVRDGSGVVKIEFNDLRSDVYTGFINIRLISGGLADRLFNNMLNGFDINDID